MVFCGELRAAVARFFSAAVVCGFDHPRAAPSVFRNRRGSGMSRCMRAPQVVRLCVPLLLVWQRRVGAMPRARIALRRRRARACNWHKIICGCISLVNDVGDASSCIGMHIYAVAHSSAATRCFLAVILASFLYRLLRWLSDVGLFSRLLVSAPTESYHLYSRSFAPTEGNRGTYSPFSGGENPTPKTNQPQH